MINKEIHLFEFAKSPYGLVISPMLASFIPIEDSVTAFDPHRHDSYGLFLLSSGEMTILVEGKEVVMRERSLLLVQPGQVHQCVESMDISGWVLFFDGQHLDAKIRAFVDQGISEIALFKLNSYEHLSTDQLLLSIYQVSGNTNPGPMQRQVLNALINALFYQTANLHLMHKSLAKSLALRPAQIVQEFQYLIKSSFRNLKKPADYAGLLHISVSHLNDTVKAHMGYSATRLIQQELIGEAQRQLRYSSKTVKEIAINLGFSDYKYFTRFFTKILGQSPSIFRKNTELTPRA